MLKIVSFGFHQSGFAPMNQGIPRPLYSLSLNISLAPSSIQVKRPVFLNLQDSKLTKDCLPVVDGLQLKPSRPVSLQTQTDVSTPGNLQRMIIATVCICISVPLLDADAKGLSGTELADDCTP